MRCTFAVQLIECQLTAGWAHCLISPVKQPDSGPVRFGLIGCGAWGSKHARTIARTNGAKLAAIAAHSEGSRAAAKTLCPEAAIYADYYEMLEKEALEVADIVLPSHLHFEAAKAALNSGSHVLLEKPMCLDLTHCDELIGLARQRQLHLVIGHEFRLSSLWGRVKEMVDRGAIGQPRYAIIELWRKPYRLGSDGWRYDIGRVGNWILEEPIHFFDLARWYFGTSGQPVSISACASNKREDHPELQDNFSAMLRFSHGGYAVISQTLAAYEHHQAVKLTGTNGALWATWSGAMDRTPHPSFSLKYFDRAKVEEIPLAKITGEIYELEEEIANMAAIVRGWPSRCATGEDGRWSVALCLKAQESVLTGKVVQL
ncbi:Oxidoreductase domain protein [Verrucomicrobia bacterium]|nr:Oxidoreductase domain protein [Verrucomicrobiota bacterium]